MQFNEYIYVIVWRIFFVVVDVFFTVGHLANGSMLAFHCFRIHHEKTYPYTRTKGEKKRYFENQNRFFVLLCTWYCLSSRSEIHDTKYISSSSSTKQHRHYIQKTSSPRLYIFGMGLVFFRNWVNISVSLFCHCFSSFSPFISAIHLKRFSKMNEQKNCDNDKNCAPYFRVLI